MKSIVRVTKAASQDISEALAYHQEEEPFRARQFLDSLRAAIVHIADYPEAAPKIEIGILRRRGFRQVQSGPYRVIYTHIEGICWILAVIHNSRELNRVWKSRKRSIES